jgi:predicted nucleic-acid-binding Zn-ribbon protein
VELHSPQWSCIKENRDSIEEQVLQGGEMSKFMTIPGETQGSMKNELFEWFCHACKYSIAVDGQTVKSKAN